MRLAQLRSYRLCYMATPYTKYEKGLDEAFKDACFVASLLIRDGIKIFAPICHSHPIAAHGEVEPLDHGVWLAVDEPLMEAAEALVIVKLDGFDESYGVDYEKDVFEAAGKPVFYLDPNTMELSQ